LSFYYFKILVIFWEKVIFNFFNSLRVNCLTCGLMQTELEPRLQKFLFCPLMFLLTPPKFQICPHRKFWKTFSKYSQFSESIFRTQVMHENLRNRHKDKTQFGKYFPYAIRKTFSEIYVFSDNVFQSRRYL
jgi:hypothetical protein